MTSSTPCRFLVLCLATLTTNFALGQKHVVYPTVPPPPHTPQEILLLFSGNTADERILLTLNNNRPDVLTTSITVYTAAGVPTVLPDVNLVPQESKMIELSPLLKAAGLGQQELGWLKLNYSGVILEMGAQLTLYPSSDGPGMDSPRSLSTDFKTTERDAVFWMPQNGKARLALTNGSAANISVEMNCGHGSEEFVIPSKTTKIRHIELPDGPIVHAGRAPVSCEIMSDGAVDALRPVGSVVAPGYSAPIRFYDPKTATFQSLTAVGLETTAETHVTVHNVTDRPVEFTPIVRGAALSNPFTQALAARKLAPHDSAEVDIGSLLHVFQANGISRITLTLKTDSPKGAFIGAVTQISSPDKLVEDIPLRTSNPPAFARGSYPLRWDEDYTNLVTVTNTAEETLRIGGQITAGDITYVFKRTDIEPGATIVFDVDEWRRDGVPDVNGKTIPKDAPYGKFHWMEMSYGKKAGLLGRTSLSSVRNRRKSSFSCGSTCQYNFQQNPYFDLQLPTTLATGGNQVSNITEYDSMTNGNYYTYPVAYGAVYVTQDSSAIASTGPDSSTSTNVIEYGNAGGTTNIYNLFYDDEYEYDANSDTCDMAQSETWQSGPTTVQTPTYFFNTSGTNVQGSCIYPNVGSFFNLLNYVADQSSNRISLAGMTPLEQGPGMTSYGSFATPTTTSSSGSFYDYPVGSCFSGLPPGGQYCATSFTVPYQDIMNGTTYTISTTTLRRDCALGNSVTFQGNPSSQNKVLTQGTVN